KSTGLSAATMVADGLCTALSSDYYYPSMLQAPFRLAADGILPFHEAWKQVSAGPAAAVKLHDRGAIAAGMRADLLLVAEPADVIPAQVMQHWVAGMPVYRAF
ncbi:MAG: amidohydrolase family protein, partial [Brachymonas sp.]|nr:amidohydrolase family protein [Brachymonas sp.]